MLLSHGICQVKQLTTIRRPQRHKNRLLRCIRAISCLTLSCTLALSVASCATSSIPTRLPSRRTANVVHKLPAKALYTHNHPRTQEGATIEQGTGAFIRMSRHKRAHRGSGTSGFELNFVNTDIKTVVNSVLTQALGLPVIIDPGVSGALTLESDQPLTAQQAMASLEFALRSEGLVLVRISGVFHVMPSKRAIRRVNQISLTDHIRSGFGVYIVPLKYVSARNMASIIKPFVPKDDLVRADSARNLLELSGTDQEIRSLTHMIRMFDVNWLSGMSFALFPVKYTTPKTLADELSRIFSGPNTPIAGLIRVVPLKSINSILVVTPQAKYLHFIKSWIARLDVGSLTPGRRLYVYDVQNGRALVLARSLERIFSLPLTSDSSSLRSGGDSTQFTNSRFSGMGNSMGLMPSNPTQEGSQSPESTMPETSGGASLGAFQSRIATRPRNTPHSEALASRSSNGLKIVPDSDNNSLLIYATANEFQMIRSALRQLDVLPLEVVINASIAEVTLNDGLQYGLNFSYLTSHGPVTLSDTSSGSIAQKFPGLSFLYSGGTNIAAVLNALESITKVRVLSSPKLVVLNNHQAELEVGDEVPIVTQTSVSTVSANAPIVNSVQMLNTGVILQVIPRANESGQVLLKISQEVSDVVPTTTSNIDSPTVEQRQISTTVAVHNGDTIVLGGLIQDSKSVARSGIPYLRRLPVIGNLFGSTNNNDTRTELIVLLTPHVVHSAVQVDSVMGNLKKQFGELRRKMPK